MRLLAQNPRGAAVVDHRDDGGHLAAQAAQGAYAVGLAGASSDINDILEKENIGKVHIISMSLGTLVAMEFAFAHTEKVKSIILAGFVMNLGLGYKTLLAIVEGFKYIVPKKFFYPMFANIMMPAGTIRSPVISLSGNPSG